MKYVRPNQKIIEKYIKIYDFSKEKSCLEKCVLGKEKEYRINNRDSYITSITDPEVFLENVAYPIYLDGEASIRGELKAIMKEFANSPNPLEFYQAFNYLCGEMMLMKIYEELPFVMFDDELASVMSGRLEKMRLSMQNYREGDFGKYKQTMYDMVCEIAKTSPLLMKNGDKNE